MPMKEIKATEIDGNLISAIAEEWMLVTAGDADKFNTMTASWGFVGEMWGRPCAVAAIRPQRYTYEFMEQGDTYTLSFYGPEGKGIHKVCGSKSGRDVDKVAEAGLTPVLDPDGVYFEGARLVLFCKKLYADDLHPERFVDQTCLEKWYDGDYHRMYVGEIVKVLQRD